MPTSLTTRVLGVTVAALATVGLATATAFATTPGHDGKLAFNRGGDIYTVNLNGTGLARLTTDGGGNGWPAWSPDGTRLAWVHKGQVWIMNANGSAKKQLATGASPSWSPDGKTIAYAGLDKSDKTCGAVPVIFTKPVAGGAATVIEGSNYGTYCSWGTQDFTWGHTTAWYGSHVEYGYSMNDMACDPYCNSYGFADNPAVSGKVGYGTLVVQENSGDTQLPAPDVDTSPARPNVVWTADGGVQVTRIDGTFHKTVVTDAKAYAPKYDPANTAIFYSTRTSAGTYVVKQVGLAAGSVPKTVLTNASQPDVQPVS
jgi:dipeptidyl aminopeptidase/acylaminoacyl peptidase